MCLCIERLLGVFPFATFPPMSFALVCRIFFLDFRRVAHDHFGKIDGRPRAEDRPLKALADEARNETAMIEVRMRQQQRIDFTWGNGTGLPVSPKERAFLKHAAIDEHFRITCLETVSRTCHLAIRAEEMQLHGL